MARILDFSDGFESSVQPTASPVAASEISNTPSGNLSALTMQDAVNELQGDIDTINTSKGAINGIATLDAGGKVPSTQMPALAITEVFVVADIAARDALTVEEGDVAKVLDDGSGNQMTYIYTGSAWTDLSSDGALAIHMADTSTHGVSGAIVGTSDAQILTNKDIDGGTASNARRITLPKDTKGSLDSLTRKAGTVVYGTDTLKAYIDNGTSLVAIGSGSGSGGLNYITNPDFETDLTGWSTYGLVSPGTIDSSFAPWAGVIDITSGLAVGDAFCFLTIGGTATGATINTVYYIIEKSTSLFKFSATRGGAAIATSGSGDVTVVGAQPFEGTGGSPSVTLTRSTSSPLASTASAVFTKGAVNAMGQGFSFDFTIDAAYRGQQMAINYLTQLVSGTYAVGDMVCWIRDLTNGVNIQPSAFQVQSTSMAGPAQPMVFQTASNSTSYRLIFHCATASTSAYTLKFDNFSVGPQVVPMGAAMTDWTTFTPTGSWTTNTTYTGRWRRVGDSAEYRLKLALAGAPNATALNLNLTSGHAIDASKLAQTTAGTGTLGHATILDSGVAAYSGTVQYGNTTIVNIYTGNAGGTYTVDNNVTQAVPIAFGANDAVDIEFSVPIVGWSSNTVVSDSTASRAIAFKATKTSGSHTATGTFQTVTWDATPLHDDIGGFNGTTDYAIKVPGRYRIDATIAFGINTTTIIQLNKNSTQIAYSETAGSPAGTSSSQASTEVVCNVGDVINVKAWQSSGGSLAYAPYDGLHTFTVSMIQGPAQIQAATLVSCALSGSSTSITSSTVDIVPTTSSVTAGTFSTATYTAAGPGRYSLKAMLRTASGAAWVASNSLFLYYSINGGASVEIGSMYAQTSHSSPMTASGSDEVTLAQGDTVKFRAFATQTVAAAEFKAQITRLSGVN